MDHHLRSFEQREPWAVQAGAEKILAAEDMRDYAIYPLDAEGRVASWNTGAARLEGYSSGEVIGRHNSLFYPRDQVASRYPEWVLERAAEDGFFIDRGWRVRKDGSWYWAHVVMTVQRTPGGLLDGFVKVVRNETAADARRERTARRFTDLFELAPSAIGLLDDSGRILEANGALCDLLGYRLPELREVAGSDVLHETDTGGDLISGTPVSTVQQPIPHRVLRHSDGSPVSCQIYSAASVRDDGSRSWLVIFHDVSEQLRHAETLRHQATHDELTGLLNRRGFEERMSRLASVQPGEIGVVFCDLNNFKRVNDALGHEAGDRLLAAVAKRLQVELPLNCEPARFYGDEFAIICTDLHGEADLAALTREIAGLFQMEVPLEARHVRLSASAGSALVTCADTSTIDLLRSAEVAMNEDRVRGHGQLNTAIGNARPDEAKRDQLALEEHLREAIGQDRIDLHYQPVIDNDGSVIIAEVLLRWQHPELGPLSPEVVLEVARGGGMLAELDGCVLRNALREAVGWQSPSGKPVRVSINLAGLLPEQPDFVRVVRDAIKEAGIDPGRVVLELVESVLARLDAESRERMMMLVDDGVQFAVDDFGTGYSSLARIKEMPTQIIKLDRRFVSGVGVDPDDLGIARAITELGRTLGRFCIAEGVENTTQHHLLRAVAVDAYQGYLFSPPIPPGQFRAYLAEPPFQR
ncbi:hypothetical protein GCM10009854_17870 [Saccharopolyspora halophila]|uniref:Uncharacterized protein n=1 Tax=Saccharopolyspora halophila TaxID=405551 RepID=A0ABN3G0N9_9PSEU